MISHSAKATAGGELSLVSIASAGVKRGYNVHAIVPNGGLLKKKLKETGVVVKVIPFTWWVHNSITNPIQLAANYRAVKKIMKYIKELDSPIIITNTLVHPWGALAAARLGSPHIWFVREYNTREYGLRLILGEKRSIRFASKYSCLLFANSFAVKDHLTSVIRSRQNILVSYPYIFLRMPSEVAHRKKSNKKLFELLIVGGVAEYKGQLDAVKMLSTLKRKDVILTLVGSYSEPYKKTIESYMLEHGIASDQVQFLGLKVNPEPYFQRADIYLMTSKVETFGRVTIEAMTYRLPVVGIKSGGTPEIVVDGETGLLSDPDDINSFTQNVEKLLDNPALRERFGENGYERVRSEFNEKKCHDPFFSAIDDVETPSVRRLASLALLLILVLEAFYFCIQFVYRSVRFIARRGGKLFRHTQSD